MELPQIQVVEELPLVGMDKYMPPNNQQPNNPVDQQALDLTHAIALSESKGSNGSPNYNAKGPSGEKGAYQWMPGNFESGAKAAGLDPNDFSPMNQDKVAYYQVKQYKDKGYQPHEISSLWNSGSPNNWQNHTGTNSQGIKYDTPKYVQSVKDNYQKILGKTGQTQPDVSQQTPTDPNAPDAYGATFKANAGDNPLVAGAKALGNVPSSTYNLGKGLVNAVAHPIKTAEGIGNALAGGAEELWNKISGGTANNTQTQTFDSLKKALYDRYGTLENAQRSATNDPVGVGTDILTILEGGTALADKALGTSSREALNMGLQKGATPIANTIKAPFNVAKNATVGLLGGLTGKGGGAVGEALNAGASGMDSYKTFMSALKTGAEPEQIVGEAKNALGQLVSERANNYKTMLSSIKADPTTYDISPINNEIQKQLDNFNITSGEGGQLDFSRSKIRFDNTAQKDIQTIVDTMKGFGTKAGDRTALGVDNLKQAFGNLDTPSSPVRTFTTAVTKATRAVLDGTPGYTKAMADYGEMSDQITQIQKALSLGDRASAETAFNKLIQAVKGNNPIKSQVLKELDQITGGKLIPKIAGSMLSPGFSKGILGHLAEIGGIAGLAGGAGFMPLLVSMMTTSPKLVGAFIATLGLGTAKTAEIMNYLNKLVLPANALNRLSPSELQQKIPGLFQGNVNPQTPRFQGLAPNLQ